MVKNILGLIKRKVYDLFRFVKNIFLKGVLNGIRNNSDLGNVLDGKSVIYYGKMVGLIPLS